VPAALTLTVPALFALIVLSVVTAAPAHAHTRAQASSSYESRITGLPELDGVEWRMYAGGDLIEVINHGSDELVVLGYEDEPYLRLGPDGVFENLNSPATYVNTDRYGDVAIPPRADPTAPPAWTRVADGPSRAWHDHRVHWMAEARPQVVVESSGGPVHIHDWSVPVVHDGQQHELTGELHWVPRGTWWPLLLVALVLTAPAAAGLLRRQAGRSSLVRPAAAVVAAVAALNTIHFVDELLAWPAPTLDILFGLFHTALFVGVGLGGAAIAWRGRQGPLLSLGIASGAVLFHQGLLQVPILTSSQLPTIWPAGLLRMAVAASIAQAVWVASVIVRAHRGGGASSERSAPPPQAGLDRAVSGRTDGDRPLHKELI
jgi:hypothetical protein